MFIFATPQWTYIFRPQDWYLLISRGRMYWLVVTLIGWAFAIADVKYFESYAIHSHFKISMSQTKFLANLHIHSYSLIRRWHRHLPSFLSQKPLVPARLLSVPYTCTLAWSIANSTSKVSLKIVFFSMTIYPSFLAFIAVQSSTPDSNLTALGKFLTLF